MTSSHGSARLSCMTALYHEHTPDYSSFIEATQRASDKGYDYVADKIGLEAMTRNFDTHYVGKQAIEMFERADIEALRDFEDVFDSLVSEVPDPKIVDNEDASREYCRLLSLRIGTINGYTLTHIAADRVIVDQVIRTRDLCLIVVSLDAQLSPIGDILVQKDRHLVQPGHQTMVDPLAVGLEDIALIDSFVEHIINKA